MRPEAALTAGELAPGEEGLWEEFLGTRAANATFYHSLPFLDFYAFKARRVLRLVFRRRGRVVALLPAGLVERQGRLEFVSPFSASFSGFCYGQGLGLAEAWECVRLAEDYARGLGAARLELGQPPIIYGGAPDQRLEFCLLAQGFRPARVELTCYVPAGAQASAGVRRKVARAERLGLAFRETPVRQAAEFLAAQKAKRGLQLSVPEAELAALESRLPGRVRAWGAYEGPVLAGAIIVYLLSERVALGFNWDQDYERQGLRASDFLLARTIEHCLQAGRASFDLGTVTLNGEPNWGLTRFKEHLGALGCLRVTYAKELAGAG